MKQNETLERYIDDKAASNTGSEKYYFITEGRSIVDYSEEVKSMCIVSKGSNHGAAPIPQEGKWTKVRGYHNKKRPGK